MFGNRQEQPALAQQTIPCGSRPVGTDSAACGTIPDRCHTRSFQPCGWGVLSHTRKKLFLFFFSQPPHSLQEKLQPETGNRVRRENLYGRRRLFCCSQPAAGRKPILSRSLRAAYQFTASGELVRKSATTFLTSYFMRWTAEDGAGGYRMDPDGQGGGNGRGSGCR